MIVVIDYGIGNVGSIVNMGRKAGLPLMVSADAQTISRADKLILPGVGAFDNGMKHLNERGLVPVLNECVLQRKIPLLGICLGMQLFARRSEEGSSPGLSWIAGDTIRFRFEPDQSGLKIPHMGWNQIEPARADPLLHALPGQPRFYFVHSYHVVCDDENDVLAWTTYGKRFVSAVRHDNLWGTQFHPEKSHKFGLALLRNFAAC